MIRYLWLVVAIAAAYILSTPVYQLVPSLVDGITRGVLSSDHMRLLRTDMLVETVGHLAAGAIILTFAGFTVTAVIEGMLVAIARNRIISAHDEAGPKTPFSKARFQDSMGHAPFLDDLVSPYIKDLRSVHAEKKVLLKRGKENTNRYETLEAVRSAGEFVGPAPLVDRRLFLWLFMPLPAILWGVGIVATAFAFARVPNGQETIDWAATIPTAALVFGLAGAGALLATVLTRPLLVLRRNQANRFAADLDHLLQFQPVTLLLRDLQVSAVTQSRHIDTALKTLNETVATTAKDNGKAVAETVADATAGVIKSLRQDIEKAIATPLAALTDTAKHMSEDQSAQIQQVLRSTLKAFVAEIEKHVGSEIKESQALVKAVADQAGKLEKSYADANKALAKQAKTQATDLANALDKALKTVANFEKSSQTALRDGLTSAGKDLAATADKLKTLSETAEQLVSSLKPALDEVNTNQKALLASLESQGSASKIIGSAATDLKAAAKASKESVEGFVGLAEKMRQTTAALRNGATATAVRPELTDEVGKGLRQLRNRAGKDLPKL